MFLRSSLLLVRTSHRTSWFTSADGSETTQEDLYQNYTFNPVTSETEEQISARVKYLQNVDRIVWLIFAPILLVTGLTGNTLSILVMRR